MIRVLTSILLITLCIRHAWGGVCESDVTTTEIDWTKLRGTWYDVVEISNDILPWCWDYEEFLPIENGIRITSYEHEFGHQEESKPTYREFIHQSGGIYIERSLNVTKFNEELESSLVDLDRKKTEEVIQKADDLVIQRTTIFLTDYQKYFIAGVCTDAGFQAFVKSPTWSIGMEFFDKISDALRGIGLNSPTMNIKMGCNKTGY